MAVVNFRQSVTVQSYGRDKSCDFSFVRFLFVSLIYSSGSSSVSSVNLYYSAVNSFSFSELTVLESNQYRFFQSMFHTNISMMARLSLQPFHYFSLDSVFFIKREGPKITRLSSKSARIAIELLWRLISTHIFIQ